MPTFAQKQARPQERVSSSRVRSNTAVSGSSKGTSPPVRLERILGNQAVLGLHRDTQPAINNPRNARVQEAAAVREEAARGTRGYVLAGLCSAPDCRRS
jgi:hypothetical protein